MKPFHNKSGFIPWYWQSALYLILNTYLFPTILTRVVGFCDSWKGWLEGDIGETWRDKEEGTYEEISDEGYWRSVVEGGA